MKSRWDFRYSMLLVNASNAKLDSDSPGCSVIQPVSAVRRTHAAMEWKRSSLDPPVPIATIAFASQLRCSVALAIGNALFSVTAMSRATGNVRPPHASAIASTRSDRHRSQTDRPRPPDKDRDNAARASRAGDGVARRASDRLPIAHRQATPPTVSTHRGRAMDRPTRCPLAEMLRACPARYSSARHARWPRRRAASAIVRPATRR
jgi:hypothetical protein